MIHSKDKFREVMEQYKKKREQRIVFIHGKGFIEIGKPDKALEIFKNTNKSLAGISEFSICSNDTVNTIFYIKQKEALKSDIEFRAKVDETYPILINDYDLARLLGNVIDNAINASKQLKYDKKIELFMSISSGGLDITVKNRFDKKAEKPKKSNINHGNGILIVKEISSLYKGTYNATKNDDIWITKISIPNVKKQ